MKSGRRRLWKCLLVAGLLTSLAFASFGCVEDTYTVCSSGCTYTSIQAAIETARAGATIEVCSGTYYENVNVNKQLILRGVDTGSGKPVVDAGGIRSAITLSHDGIVLDGFTAINASEAGIQVYANNNIVRNNTVSNNDQGISLDSSSNNTLTGNTASNNSYGISLFSSCNNNNLTGNTANSNTNYGIYLYSSSSSNTLKNNTVSNNYYGIYLLSSSDNTLTNNIASNNSYRGIFLSSSNNNNLMGNSADSNNDQGISLDSSSNNTLTNNTATSNYFHGIYLSSSSSNALTGNIASNNKIGIRLSYASNQNALTGNTATSNNKYGLYLDSSSNNTLTGNTANSNSRSGMYIPYSSKGNHIYNNYFDNAVNAYDSGSNIWNISQTAATNIIGGPWFGGNYWSDYAGEDTNGDGFGDTKLPYNSSGNIVNGGDWLPLVNGEPSIFDTGEGG